MYIWVFSVREHRNNLSSFIEYIHQVLCSAVILSHCLSIYRFKSKLISFGRTVATLSKGCVYKLYIPTVYTLTGSAFFLLLFVIDAFRKKTEILSFLYVFVFLVEFIIYLITMSFCVFLEIFQEHFKGIINDVYSKR